MFTLLLRWLTAWGMWAVLRQIWPQRQQAVTWMTLLFLVYPSFLLGAFSVAFSQHFITYALFFLSLLLMISAINNPRRALPLTIFGMFTALLHMATMEYMAGLEFVRPLIVWLLLGGVSLSRQERIKRMLKIWMPYLMVWLFFAVWRLVILEIPDDPNAPKLIYALQESPITALLGLVETILRHILYVLVTTWNRALDPYLIDLKSRFGMFTWGVMLFVLPSLYYIFSRERAITEKNNWEWQKNALILGLYSIIVGLLPVWFTGREIYTGRYSDRFSLPALFGASILLITIIYYFVSVNSRKVFIMSLLVTFAIGVQMRAINHYRWDWVYQQRFYWQLQWRAPGLKPQTGLVLEGLYSDYVASYAIAAAVNTLYPQINTEDQFLDYW
ncbi:MAG: hypothetical protein OEY93_06165, partial [Anaerolineae bacterium]|nr:hypothetical protein [Anaerolineae bacterium]